MGRRFSRAIGLTSVGLLLAMGAGCSSAGGNEAPSGLEKMTLTVGAVPVADEAGLYIAEDEGLFKDEGLNVKIDSIVSSAVATQDQNNGTFDVTAGNSVSYIQDQVSGRSNLEIVAEGSLMQPNNQALYTLPGSPDARGLPRRPAARPGDRRHRPRRGRAGRGEVAGPLHRRGADRGRHVAGELPAERVTRHRPRPRPAGSRRHVPVPHAGPAVPGQIDARLSWAHHRNTSPHPYQKGHKAYFFRGTPNNDTATLGSQLGITSLLKSGYPSRQGTLARFTIGNCQSRLGKNSDDTAVGRDGRQCQE
jgi:NMT1/THI5 like